MFPRNNSTISYIELNIKYKGDSINSYPFSSIQPFAQVECQGEPIEHEMIGECWIRQSQG